MEATFEQACAPRGHPVEDLRMLLVKNVRIRSEIQTMTRSYVPFLSDRGSLRIDYQITCKVWKLTFLLWRIMII